jgi:hypothetical protein
VRYWAVFLF